VPFPHLFLLACSIFLWSQLKNLRPKNKDRDSSPVTRPDGSVYTFGKGAAVSKVGNGILTYTFDAIRHYLPDGELHDIGHIIVKITLGNLASLSDKIGL
jgi:hypothetical protein